MFFRKRLFWGGLLLLMLLLFSYWFFRDLNLPSTVKIKKMPDVVVENLNFSRELGGWNWHMTARSAESVAGVIRASDINLAAEEISSDRRAVLHADSGEFSEESATIFLRETTGVVYLLGASVDLEAPEATFNKETGLWFFASGADIKSDSVSMIGSVASLDAKGNFILAKEVKVTWVITHQ